MTQTTQPTSDSSLKAHIGLFSVLVLTNVFVGGMVGLERTLLPLIADTDFGITSAAAAISFIATFGVTKAIVNFFAGSLSDHWGRKRVLLLGWLIGLPIPLILMFAQSWFWILFANVLLGFNQSLTWSMTVVMKGYLVAATLVGLGTAMVYPTLLALVSDVSGVTWRASALGIYRFWRDLGYAVGAIGAGVLADTLDIPTTMLIVSGLAFVAAITVAIRVKETKKS